MKKIILTFTLAIIMIAGFSQDFGIESKIFTNIESEGIDSDTTLFKYVFMYEHITKSKVILVYDKYLYDTDTTLIKVKKGIRTPLPLQDSVGGKTILEYWAPIYSKTDTIRLKQLLRYAILNNK